MDVLRNLHIFALLVLLGVHLWSFAYADVPGSQWLFFTHSANLLSLAAYTAWIIRPTWRAARWGVGYAAGVVLLMVVLYWAIDRHGLHSDTPVEIVYYMCSHTLFPMPLLVIIFRDPHPPSYFVGPSRRCLGVTAAFCACFCAFQAAAAAVYYYGVTGHANTRYSFIDALADETGVSAIGGEMIVSLLGGPISISLIYTALRALSKCECFGAHGPTANTGNGNEDIL